MKDSKLLDDIAYYLYLEEKKNDDSSVIHYTQEGLLISGWGDEYYKEAKLIERRIKVEKIRRKISEY
jgi:hypothetical protein